MAIDLAAKLKALREKKNAELNSQQSQSSGTTTVPPDPISQPVLSNNPDPTPVQSKESIETISNSDVSVLDIPLDSIGKGSGSTGTEITAVNRNDASVNFEALEFFSKLDQLEQMLLVPHPTMPVLLRDIHNRIKADPELVTVLSEEQIGIIVNGLKKQTNTELSGTVAKQSKARDKKVSISLDML